MSETVTIISSEGIAIKVDKAVAMKSHILRNMIEDGFDNIPVNSTVKFLSKITEYCEKHLEYDNTPDKHTEAAKKMMRKWDTEFIIDMDSKNTVGLARAVDFLVIPSLYKLIRIHGLKRFAGFNVDRLFGKEDRSHFFDKARCRDAIRRYACMGKTRKEEKKEAYTKQYLKLLKATEGFYAGCIPFHMLEPIAGGIFKCSTSSQFVKKAAECALQSLNLELVKVVRANSSLCHASMYYLTIEASDSEFYEAQVLHYENRFRLEIIRPAVHYPEIDASLRHLDVYDPADDVEDEESEEETVYDALSSDDEMDT